MGTVNKFTKSSIRGSDVMLGIPLHFVVRNFHLADVAKSFQRPNHFWKSQHHSDCRQSLHPTLPQAHYSVPTLDWFHHHSSAQTYLLNSRWNFVNAEYQINKKQEALACVAAG
jgi:hypothetical protein